MSPAAILAVAAAVVAAALLTVVLLRRRRRVWQRFARRHGLELQSAGNGPAVRGVLDGRPVALLLTGESSDTELLGAGEVELTVGLLRPLPHGLAIRHRTAVDAATAAEDIRTGDETFDALALVRGGDAAEIVAWLTPRRRRALEDLLRLSPSAVVEVAKGAVRVRERSTVASLDRLERRLAAVLAAAHALDEG